MTRTKPKKEKRNPPILPSPTSPMLTPHPQAMANDSVPKGSKKRSSRAAEEHESDGGFIANDNGSEDAPKPKRAKTATAKGKGAAGAKNGGDDQGEFWEISDKRRITIDSFKGNLMVNIREYYEDKNTGSMMPGKKGISLSLAQYSTLLTLLPEIETALVKKGEKVPRPDYSGAKAVGDDVRDVSGGGDDEEEEKVRKKNFEATSEEED
ncbi:MAG: hypothetical protein Q9196_001650 [Gyalolechia fulgens]